MPRAQSTDSRKIDEQPMGVGTVVAAAQRNMGNYSVENWPASPAVVNASAVDKVTAKLQ